MKIKLKETSIQKILFGVLKTKKNKTNQIVFYDYDGSVLYSYTKNEFLNLTNLPPRPNRTRENLTCDGWNWTLAEVKSCLNNIDEDINVGATYHTTDNKTHITFKPTETFPQAFIALTPTVANAVTVDWGDGTTDIWTGTTSSGKVHTYTGVTDSSIFDITISCSSGTYSFSTCITGGTTNNQNCVYTDIKLSNKVTSLGNSCFQYCRSLQSITIPSGITSLGTRCFQSCYSIKSITIPSGVTSLGSYCIGNCYSLQSISIPSSVTSLRDYCFNICYSLQSIPIPSSVTSFGTWCFGGCYSLKSITIPSGVTSLGEGCFQTCYSLQSITVPSGVTSLGNSCFYYCLSLKKIYMQPTTPPTLTSTNAIPNNENLVIYVPTGFLTTYQNASNWGSYASKMVEYDY